MPAGHPATLQQFAELAERDPSWRTRQAELPGLGKTSEILRLTGAHDRIVHVFGSYGATDLFDSRFFYVILSKEAPELGYIPSLSPFAADPRDQIRNHELDFQTKVAGQQKVPIPTSQIDMRFHDRIVRSNGTVTGARDTDRNPENWMNDPDFSGQ